MPNRIIKESICTSDSVDSLSWFEEVLFYRLIVNCDDFGRYDGRPAIIKNRLFPLKEKLKISDISEALKSLVNADLIILYVVDNKPFLQLKTWEEHQRIRAKRSKYPQPSENTCCHLSADDSKLQTNASVIQSNPIQSESNTNMEGKQNRKRFIPPTLEEVKAYVDENGYAVDAEYFYKFYSEGNWIDSKGNPVKNWKQKLITWAKKDGADQQQPEKKKQFTTAAKYEPPHKTIDVEAFNKLNAMFGGNNEI